VGLGVSVGALSGHEGAPPRFYRLRRLRQAFWSVIDPVTVCDLDLDVYESASRLAARIDRTLAAVGLPSHQEPSAHGSEPFSFDLPGEGVARLEQRLGEPLVDVYLPRELDGVVDGPGIRIASARRLHAACARAAADLGPLPDPGDDPAEFDADGEERYVCAVLMAAADESLRRGAAVVVS
jgi:hypothetical protein